MIDIYHNATGIKSLQWAMYTVIAKSQNIEVLEIGTIHNTGAKILGKYDRNKNIHKILEKSNAKRQKR